MKATATAKAASDAWVDSVCLTPHGTISLAELSMRGAGFAGVLEDLAPLTGVKLERPNGLASAVVRLSDLDQLLGPERATAARKYKPDMVPSAVLDLAAILTVGNEAEAVALAARRGVLVNDQTIDKTAAEALGRILAAETSGRYDWSGQHVHDIVSGTSKLQEMTAAMVTQGPWPTGIPPLPPPPPPREPWEPPARKLSYAELPMRILDDDAGTRERCRIMGIRTEEGNHDSGNRIRICGYDLWRLLGIAPASRRQKFMYGEMQKAAYESVFQTGKDI